MTPDMPTIPQKLKILYLITKSNYGGAQRYVHDLAVEAKRHGHDVVVGFGQEGLLAEKLTLAGIRMVAIPNLGRDVNLLADIKSFRSIQRLIARERPDVIHLNSSKMGAMGALAGRLHNGMRFLRLLVGQRERPARIIFTGHGWAFNEERGDIERFLIGLTHWLTIALAHRSIAVSHKTREEVSRLPFVKQKLVVIHNGVDNIKFLSKKRAREEIFSGTLAELLERKSLVVGTLAELHKNKGLEYAIEGFALLKKQFGRVPIFVILGEGEERARLERLIAERGLGDTVLLTGYREHAARLLLAFDIFLLPSITEAFPYAILEAGCAGLPTVATAVGGIPEVIDDMESGILIQSKNPAEIARAIAYLYENPERRNALGESLKSRIAGRFNVTTMAKHTFALYETQN